MVPIKLERGLNRIPRSRVLFRLRLTSRQPNWKCAHHSRPAIC
ncbi:Uncharacterised protein [Vibrio cholerae]|nr:Uncharacterised protein [Vibrio cholerae]